MTNTTARPAYFDSTRATRWGVEAGSLFAVLRDTPGASDHGVVEEVSDDGEHVTVRTSRGDVLVLALADCEGYDYGFFDSDDHESVARDLAVHEEEIRRLNS
jgi:hypothetical protein